MIPMWKSSCINCEAPIELVKIQYAGYEWQHLETNQAECPTIEGCTATPLMTFDEWMAFGIEQGYCTDQYCETHDGAPMSDTEAAEFDEGGDPCIHVVRLGSIEDWA